MPQREIEVILTRQLASYLSLPIFIVDTGGTLVFYNEPAERIHGHRLEETGEMPADEVGHIHNDPTHPGPSWVDGMLLRAVDQDFATTLLSSVAVRPM